MKVLNLITTIKTFIAQHEVVIADLSFIAGYLFTIIAVTILILFFGIRYIRKRQKPDEKTIKGFTKDSLLLLFDFFMFISFFCIGHAMGIKDGLNEELTPFFDTFPPFLYSLMFVPVLLFCFFTAEFLNDRFLYVKFSKGIRHLFNFMKKRGHLHDDIKSSDIPDIPDSDTSGGTPDRSLHHDRYGPQYTDKRGR